MEGTSQNTISATKKTVARPSVFRRIRMIARREVGFFVHRPALLFLTMIVPLLSVVMFTTMMNSGLPTKLPAGIVDQDNTKISRTIVRTLDAFQQTNLKYSYPNFQTAKEAMIKGEICAFFLIPKGTTREALFNRQPSIAFYTNEAYYVAGTLLMKDMRYVSEIVSLVLARENLYAHGKTPYQAATVMQPIVVETHPLNNPYLNYSVYLNTMVVPAIFFLVVMVATAYVMGLEWKQGTQRRLCAMAGNNPAVAIIGKLLPYTLLFFLIMLLYTVVFYKLLHFPCHCNVWEMVAFGWLGVLASQGVALIFLGILPGKMRIAMCMCSLWGIVAVSITGFTYPVTAMDPPLMELSNFFPLRHYYLLYVNQALNGYPLHYVLPHLGALMLFIFVPIFLLPVYNTAFRHYHYQP